MDRARVWPPFRASWKLYEDDDLVVIDKPCGVPTQAADPSRPDDIVFRLKLFEAEVRRAANGGSHVGEIYFGVHHRLDRDTSGALLLVKQKRANGSIAAQFEKRTIEKRYLAGVIGFPKGKREISMRDHLLEESGLSRVVPAKTRGAKEAVARARLVKAVGDRALVELTLETGRLHQARVQLAHRGAPIAGDPLYGAAPAPRLLLHASSLKFVHPTTNRAMVVSAPPPLEFDAWLNGGDRGAAVFDDDAVLRRAVALAVERRYGLAHSHEEARATTAFRLINEDGDALPRLAVDVYGEFVVIQFYDDAARGVAHENDDPAGIWSSPTRRARVVRALAELGFRGGYSKVRPKQANVIVDSRRDEFAPKTPAFGEAAPSEFVILEEGIPIRVRLADGLSTGIFLDQREARARVRSLAAGSRVLNLFSYTCAFSVAAAIGGSVETVSVDASATILDRGRENFETAGVVDRAAHELVADDAQRFLDGAIRRGRTFDLVILDPPSYSATKHHRFSAESDYAKLAAQALRVLAPGGKLLASTNHRRISKRVFRKILFDAGRLAETAIEAVRDLPDPSDYPFAVGSECHLKSALVTLARAPAPRVVDSAKRADSGRTSANAARVRNGRNMAKKGGHRTKS